jgi:hypothetical protein
MLLSAHHSRYMSQKLIQTLAQVIAESRFAWQQVTQFIFLTQGLELSNMLLTLRSFALAK